MPYYMPKDYNKKAQTRKRKGINLLLDNVTGSVVAYSLRQLKKTATKSIRVRRSNDNEELDIGFLNDKLDTNTLINFVGGNSAYVIRWYDQTGNGLDAIETTSPPRIVNAGTYDEMLVFSGAESLTIASNALLSLKTAMTITTNFIISNDATSGFLLSNSRDGGFLFQYALRFSASNNNLQFYVDGNNIRYTELALTRQRNYDMSMTWDGLKVINYIDGVESGRSDYSAEIASDGAGITIGKRGTNSDYMRFRTSEIILFNRALTEQETIDVKKN